MEQTLALFKQCVELKKQADQLGVLEGKKKLKLADQAINSSFGVIGGLIDSQINQEQLVIQLKEQLAELIQRVEILEQRHENRA